MSHLNGFYVVGKGNKKYGEYFAIQANQRIGTKVVTHHLMYIGKNKVNHDLIRNLNDAGSVKSLPLEVLFSDSGRQYIIPEDIQKAYEKKAEGYGVINEKHRNLIHRHLDIPESDDITIFDMQKLVEQRIDTNDKITNAIINVTGPEMYEFIDISTQLDSEIEKAKNNAKLKTVAKKEDDSGNVIDATTNDFIYDEEEDLKQEHKETEKIKTKVKEILHFYENDIAKLDQGDQYDFFIIQQKINNPNFNHNDLILDERNLIDKYHKENIKTPNIINKFTQEYEITPEIAKLEAKKQDFLNKHKEDIDFLKNVVINGNMDKLRLNMKYQWQKLQQMEDIQCVVADTFEYRAGQLIKTVLKDELQGTDKAKSLFISQDLRMETYDEVKHVSGAHFSYKLALDMIDKKGNSNITLQSYQKGSIRKFLNEQVKSGHLIKQFTKEGNESTYFSNVFDTINKGRPELYRKAQIDFKALKLEARKIAKEKLNMQELSKEERGQIKKSEVKNILKKKEEEIIKKAKEIVHKREIEHKKKYSNKGYTEKGRSREIERVKKKLLREEENKAVERLIDKSIKIRAEKMNLKKGTKEYQEELEKVQKWHKKYLTLETKKQEFNLMRKYTLSKKSVERIVNKDNIAYFEELAKKKDWKNIREIFTHELNESKHNTKRKNLYDRGIKNFQEFSFMMSLASSNKGELLKNAKTILDIFELNKMFK